MRGGGAPRNKLLNGLNALKSLKNFKRRPKINQLFPSLSCSFKRYFPLLDCDFKTLEKSFCCAQNPLIIHGESAFTMAEVLITLGVIGIVAAMTLPGVINNARDKQFRSMFKKQYSVISQAMLLAYLEEENVYEHVDWRVMSRYVCKVGKNLKEKYSGLKCEELSHLPEDTDPNNGYIDRKFMWHKEGEWFDKTGKPLGTNSAFLAYTFFLPDGAMINFNSINQVFVDVNGMKNPNTVGRDIFYFVLLDKSNTTSFFKTDGTISVNGFACPDNCIKLTNDNYQEDCLNGTGWGCSPMYILD